MVVACGNNEKTVSPTAVPTQIVTATPTSTPTPIITPTPTATPTLAPTVPPTKTPTPKPTFTVPPGYISEELMLMVGPDQPRVLTMVVQASDSVQVAVNKVTPADVPFGCKVINPYNEVILDLEQVKAPGFKFEAISSGYYIINLSISPILLTNAVLFLEVHHRGPVQFPPLSGIYVVVEHGKTASYDLTLNYEDRIQGSFTIQGGDQELLFSFLDPSGNVVGPAGRVEDMHSFTEKMNTSGQFKFVFNNTATYATKLVTLQYTVYR